jgi:hypothetical protein
VNWSSKVTITKLVDNFYINILELDTSVQLSTRDDCFLIEIAHLILQISFKGEVAAKANLFSQESSPGVWDADQILTL